MTPTQLTHVAFSLIDLGLLALRGEDLVKQAAEAAPDTSPLEDAVGVGANAVKRVGDVVTGLIDGARGRQTASEEPLSPVRALGAEAYQRGQDALIGTIVKTQNRNSDIARAQEEIQGLGTATGATAGGLAGAGGAGLLAHLLQKNPTSPEEASKRKRNILLATLAGGGLGAGAGTLAGDKIQKFLDGEMLTSGNRALAHQGDAAMQKLENAVGAVKNTGRSLYQKLNPWAGKSE